MTNEELTRRYKELYKKKTGEDLSDQEAFDQAMSLVTLVDATYRPLPAAIVKSHKKTGKTQ